MLVELRGSEPGKLDVKRHKPGFHFAHWFILQTGDYDLVFNWSMIAFISSV